MKSIVVGYADKAGKTEPMVICGPDVSMQKQAKVVTDAKKGQRFPKGIVRLEWCFVDETRTVVAISNFNTTTKKEKLP